MPPVRPRAAAQADRRGARGVPRRPSSRPRPSRSSRGRGRVRARSGSPRSRARRSRRRRPPRTGAARGRVSQARRRTRAVACEGIPAAAAPTRSDGRRRADAVCRCAPMRAPRARSERPRRPAAAGWPRRTGPSARHQRRAPDGRRRGSDRCGRHEQRGTPIEHKKESAWRLSAAPRGAFAALSTPVGLQRLR